MSIEVDRLMNNVRIHLPGVLDSMLQLELFNTLTDFLQSSNVWTENINFTVGATDTTDTIYDVEPESVATISRLNYVIDVDGHPIAAAMSIPGEIRLGRPPYNAGSYTANVTLTVVDPVARDGFPEYPAWVLTKYMLPLMDGMLGRLMAQPAKPYSNEKLGQYHLKRFANATSFAGTEAVRNNVSGAQMWRFPQTFATRRR